MSNLQSKLELEAKCAVEKRFAKSKSFLKIVNVMNKWYNETLEYEKTSSYYQVLVLVVIGLPFYNVL